MVLCIGMGLFAGGVGICVLVNKHTHSLLEANYVSSAFKKVISLQNQIKLQFSTCLIDDGWDMPSSMYDSIRAINPVSVVFFRVKPSLIHFQGA